MKIFLTCLTLLLIPAAAHAEKIHPSGWSATGPAVTSGPTIYPTRQMVGGNEIMSPQEFRQRQHDSGLFNKGEKPTLTKNANGSTTIKKKFHKFGRKSVNEVWSDLND